MRKVIIIGVITAVLALMAGTIFAQDDTTATTDSAAWLGVALAESDGQVIVARVQPGSPANAADLLIGDVVTAFNGTAVTSASQLAELVQAAAPGDTVTLDVTRNGETISIDVTLGSTPSARWGKRGGRDGFGLPAMDALWLAEHLLDADLQEADNGYEVVSVENSAFDLQEGDVVTTINGQAVAELSLESLLSDLAAADSPELTVQVVRAGEELTLTGDVFGGRFGFGRLDDMFGGRGDGRGHGMRGGRGGFDSNQPDTTPEVTPEATPETTGEA